LHCCRVFRAAEGLENVIVRSSHVAKDRISDDMTIES